MQKTAILSQETSDTANNIYEELASHHIATLGTMGKEKYPHLTAVYYMVNEKFVTSFATKDKTLKSRNIRKNNKVQLLVFDETSQLTIQINGEAHEVTNEARKYEIIENMFWVAKQNDYEIPPITKLRAGNYVAYEIIPKRISMALFLRPQSGGYDMYEVLNFDKNLRRKA